MGNLNCMKPNINGRKKNIDRSLSDIDISNSSVALKNVKFNAVDLIIENEGNIREEYVFEKEMGTGAFGDVIRVRNKASGIKRAVKVIEKDSESVEEQKKFVNEVGILRNLDHPNIIKIIEFYSTNTHFYIVMQLCTGGELFDKISSSGNFSERMACDTVRQVLSAVFYCHSHNIVHRDLKPENLLYESKKENALLKVIDFGTSSYFSPDKVLKQKSGTPYYIAPEVIKRKYDQKCDIWSIGVILYILLCGYPPFNGDDDDEIMDAVVKGVYNFDTSEWKSVSNEAKDLIKNMLKYDPKKRISAGEALNHVWIKKASSSGSIELPLLQKTLENMKNFRFERKLQEATYMFFVSHFASEEEKKELLKTFRALDTNGDGELSREELINGFIKTGKYDDPEKAVDEMMENIDFNNNGTIDYSEFLMATINKNQLLNRQRLESAFKMLDKDNSGSISISELKKIFGGKKNAVSDEMWKLMIREFDSNSDGEISLSEFKEMMLGFVGKKKTIETTVNEKNEKAIIND